MTIWVIIWIALGIAGSRILKQNPSKLIFSRSFWGTIARTVFVFFVFLPIAFGPIALLVAILLPLKKLCHTCYSAIAQQETICPNCGASAPNVQETLKSPGELLTESQLSHFSPEVQEAVEKGYKDVSLVSGYVMIGTWAIALMLAVFLSKEPNGYIILVGFPLGLVLGLFRWWYSIPKWREWALKQPGVKPDELQKAAEVMTMVLPKT